MAEDRNEENEESVLIDVPAACEEADKEDKFSWACLKAEFLWYAQWASA